MALVFLYWKSFWIGVRKVQQSSRIGNLIKTPFSLFHMRQRVWNSFYAVFLVPKGVWFRIKVLNDPFKNPRNLQEQFSDCTKVISVISSLHFAEFFLQKLIFEITHFYIFFIQCFFLKYTYSVCCVFMKIVKFEKKVVKIPTFSYSLSTIYQL